MHPGCNEKENTTIKFPQHILNEKKAPSSIQQSVMINTYLSNQQYRVASNEEYGQRLIKSLEKKARNKMQATVTLEDTQRTSRTISSERDFRFLFKESTNRLRLNQQ
jgi:hypothetical protein